MVGSGQHCIGPGQECIRVQLEAYRVRLEAYYDFMLLQAYCYCDAFSIRMILILTDNDSHSQYACMRIKAYVDSVVCDMPIPLLPISRYRCLQYANSVVCDMPIALWSHVWYADSVV
jgi:hypothetical protein